MTDTGFSVPAGRSTGSSPHTRRIRGRAVVYDPVDGAWSPPPAFSRGGGGLCSTVDDFLAFARMLSPAAVRC